MDMVTFRYLYSYKNDNQQVWSFTKYNTQLFYISSCIFVEQFLIFKSLIERYKFYKFLIKSKVTNLNPVKHYPAN